MKYEEENLRKAALNYLDAAQKVQRAASGEPTPNDPLDDVRVEVFDLGPHEPAVGDEELAELRERLDHERLPAWVVLDLMDLARRLKELLLS